MNKYLFSHLKRRGWELIIVDIPLPKILKYIALITTFIPNIPLWKKKYDKRLSNFYKSPWTFKQRTRFCEKKIKEFEGKYDVLLQISGMFAPCLNHSVKKNYFILLSYTIALSRKYPDWMPWTSQIEEKLRLEEELYQNAKTIFTTNENARESLITDYGVNKDKVIKVGYGLTLENLPEFEKTYDGKTILFVGMDFERKGGYVLLEAFKKVKEKILNSRLIIIGPNPEIYKINQPGVESLGMIRDRKITEEYYKQASIFVMPSLCEPFGLVFLEAMGYKLPCIGTNIDAMPEIIENGKTGILVSPNNCNELADKTILLLKDNSLMKQMGDNAYVSLQQRFNWQNVTGIIDINLRNYLLTIKNGAVV